ncbi:MAG: putative iron-dependent regulatory protein [bacterium]|nr:MAG: putative iron-dependent regulatory protein [bacterium]
MGSESWKSFEKNEVTHSMAHYLMAIRDLLASRGYARATDVAEYLDITRASASVAITGLRAKGLVEEDERHFMKLTDHGQELVQTILTNRRLLIRFLRDVLMIDPVVAEEEACKTEHLLSSEAGTRLFRLLRYLLSDPERTERVRGVVANLNDTCPGLSRCDVCSEFHECILGHVEH